MTILISNLQKDKQYSDEVAKAVGCEGLQKPCQFWMPHCHFCSQQQDHQLKAWQDVLTGHTLLGCNNTCI